MTRIVAYCVLTGQDPDTAGPCQLTWDDEEAIAELAQEMAKEIATSTSPPTGIAEQELQAILEEALASSLQPVYSSGGVVPDTPWLAESTGRIPRDSDNAATDENFYRSCIIIEPEPLNSPEDWRNWRRGRLVLKVVEDYSFEDRRWETLVVAGERISRQSLVSYGSVLCWERPWMYFREWMRRSSEKLAALDDKSFIEAFFSFVVTSHGDCDHEYRVPCISYGGIEKVAENEADVFHIMQQGTRNVAAAICHGVRGPDLWPALAADFNVWMTTRPDLWPSRPTTTTRWEPPIPVPETGAESILHSLPPEVLLQILALVPHGGLWRLMTTSRRILIHLLTLLDEVLWYHVHHGDLRWLLPVSSVPGEVQRAAQALGGQSMASREFPFSTYLPVCLASDSMKNRRRMWNIAQQFCGALERSL
ncbi:F-box domain-containing protein [Mycena chlorophos]|uniref:F-box domain-containing protein n=1 Tax=Mycena chlorophos TaxID=658473 RepID=A0A8H6STM7_MYCCL|nr:F-box domain-containing protein [Mycena chlorophos]